MTEIQVILGVPGTWKNRTELIQAVASKSDGYLLAGNIIHCAKKNVGFQVEVYEHDPQLVEAFSYVNDDQLMKQITNHTFTVYVIATVSDFEELKNVVDVGAGLVKAGGLAVKIETSGTIHTKEEWKELARNQEYFPIYSHFVMLVGNEESYFSCGMKAFGCPDVITSSVLPPEEAADLLNNFNLYSLIEKPAFKSGQTFSVEEGSALYRIQCLEDFRYEEDDLFFNPFGLVELVAE